MKHLIERCNDKFLLSIINNDLKIAKEMDISNANIIILALYLASINNYVEIIQILIEKNIKLTANNCLDTVITNYCLDTAITNKHCEIVEYLIKNDININKYLEIIIKNNELNLIEIYMKYTSNYDNLLLLTLKYKNLNILTLLLDKNIDIDELLLVASDICSFKVINFLLEKGANIHIDNEYPLKMACINNKIKLVKFLIKKGAICTNLSLEDIIRFNNLKVIKYLVQKNITIPNKIINDTNYRGKIIRYLKSKLNI